MKKAASSQTTLLAVAVFLTALGSMIPSPGGKLIAFAVAGLVASAALLFSSSRKNSVIACLILAFAALQAISAWHPYRASLDRYRGGASRSDTNKGPE